uniref:C6 domain-containing protein n=1 Tax=Panagrellus redivivus TaxID=6233 RepID=A0A7E4UUR3_PANRE
MKLFCILLLCAFVALSVQDYGGVVYPTDCPGGGSDCFGKVFNESKTLMELFMNLRKNFPHAEVTMDIQEEAKREPEKRCLLCKDPASTGGEDAFDLSAVGTDEKGCKIKELKCKNSGFTIGGTNSAKGVITCKDNEKWSFGALELPQSPCVKTNCAKCIVPVTTGYQITKLANVDTGCLGYSVFCGTEAGAVSSLHIAGTASLTGIAVVCNDKTEWSYKTAEKVAPKSISAGKPFCEQN